MIKHKCEECIHRINKYCRAYQIGIEMLSIENCTRRKVRTKDEKKKNGKI